MSFVNELFERLSRSSTANEVQAALASLGSIQDPNERIRAARETVALISKYAAELLERGQYKNAAYQFYSGAQLIQTFLADPNSEFQWLRSAADALTKASQEHISWDDLLGGAACMSIASLLRIQTGDWNVALHLDAFIKNNDFSANQAATACLYIPYDLAGAANAQNPNPSLLQRASGYTESYLLNTKPAAMFHEGIKRAIDITRQKLMDHVKFPSIRANYEFDYDIIFGEEFKLVVKIKNLGEGVATNVTAQIIIPSNVTVVTGTNTISVEQLDPGDQTHTNFSLICPSGEGEKEITLEISVNVGYQDVLLNQNSISLGSALIPIRSEKQAEKLINRFKLLDNSIIQSLIPLESLAIPEIQLVKDSFKTILTKIRNSIEKNIQTGEFVAASEGIDQLEKVQEFIQPLVNFLSNYNEQSQYLSASLDEVKGTSETLLKSLEKVQEQLNLD